MQKYNHDKKICQGGDMLHLSLFRVFNVFNVVNVIQCSNNSTRNQKLYRI